MNKKQCGFEKEKLAEEFLKRNDVIILDRNYSSRFGEIDIIGIKDDFLCFFEVKYRKNELYGYPEEAISKTKMLKICKTASFYLAEHKNLYRYQIRFDVISILGEKIKWIKSAFDYQQI